MGIHDVAQFEAARNRLLAVLTRDDRLRAFCVSHAVPVAPFSEWLFA